MVKNKLINRIYLFFLFLAVSFPLYQMTASEKDINNGITVLTKELLPFKGVFLDAPFHLEYQKAGKDDYRFQLEGKEEIISLIDISYDSGMLVVSIRGERKIKKKDRPRLIVFSPALPYLSVAEKGGTVSLKNITEKVFHIRHEGNENIYIDEMKTDSLHITATSGGDVEINYLESQYTFVANTGKGAVRIIGISPEINLINTHKGVINCSELNGNHVKAISKGTGNIYCNAGISLNAIIDNSGDVVYSGHPEIRREYNSNGRIRRERD